MFKWLKQIFKKEQPVKNKTIPNFGEIVKTIKLDDNRVMEVKLLKDKFNLTRERYEVVSSQCGNFPVDLLFALHYRECSLDFNRVLHNGEKILRTGKLTKLVPKNRGPFQTWEEAAVDAIMMKKSIFPSEWTLVSKLEFAEKYNGYGYRSTSEYSPYVFAGTNFHDETGKYVDDGKFDSSAPEKQLGIAALLIG